MPETVAPATERGKPPATRLGAKVSYAPIVGIIVSEMERFLEQFVNFAKMEAPASVSDEFLRKFLVSADAFSAKCSVRLASLLRESSTQSDIRGTPERVLMGLVRNRCFAGPDASLIAFVGQLKQMNLNLEQSISALSDSEVRTAASVPKSSATSGAATESGGPASAREAKMAALFSMVEYFRQVEDSGLQLLDYGAAKLYGADADFEEQKRHERNIQDVARTKIGATLVLLEGFEEIKRKIWEDQRAAETATIKAVALSALQKTTKRKSGTAWLVAGLACLAPVGIAASFQLTNPYVIGTTVLVAVVGVGLILRGLTNLFRS